MDFESYREEHGLEPTDHDRVYWTHTPPDERAYGAAVEIADEFPELTVVGTESRIQTSDVKWDLSDDRDVIVMGFYPIRADFWTHEVIEDVREALA